MSNLEKNKKISVARLLSGIKSKSKQTIQQIFMRKVFDKPSKLNIKTFGRFNVAYRSNTADEEVLNDSFDNDIFFDRIPEYNPKNGDVIIDIGAHIGTFSILASSKIGEGKVYSIEASQDSFNLLRINVALNQIMNISIHHLAMSDKQGTCTLYHDKGNWGHSTVKKLSRSHEIVKAETMSAFFEDNNITECNFLKLNCEGSEFPIILGTPSYILKTIGVILVLYHCDLWSSNTESDLISHLLSSGFHCVIREKSEKRGWIIGTNTNMLNRQLNI